MERINSTKKLSLFILTVFLVNILSLTTAVPVSAATESAAYLIADFEDGTVGNTDGNTYSLVDGPGASIKAVRVPDGSTLPAFDFGLRSQKSFDENGDGTDDVVWKYDASAWIRADQAVTSDKVELVFTLDNAETSGYNTPETLTETVTVNEAGLKKDKWVKVTFPTFTYDGKTVGDYQKNSSSAVTTKDYATNPVGTVSVKVGGGIAYTIDDLVIMPKKYTPVQSKTSNPIFTKKLQSMSSISGSTSPWSAASCTAYEFTTAYDGETVQAFGERDTISKALKITNTDYYSEVRYAGANFKFGTEYTVEFLAKAENNDALNMTPRVVLTYYGSQDEALGTWSEYPAYKGAPAYTDISSGSLADGWKKFKVTVLVNKITTETASADISFRLYGSNATTAQWSIANIDMYPTHSEFTNLASVSHFTGNRMSDGNVYADLSTSLMTGQYKAFESRLEVPYDNDYVIIKRYRNAENKDSFIYAGSEIENARIVTNICDKNNYFSKTFVTPIEITTPGFTAVAEIDQTVWAEDMPELTATVRYNDVSGEETLFALCAMYNEKEQMVSGDIKELVLTDGEGEVKLSMPTTADATSAKVFLWENGDYAPRLDANAQITKTTSGIFIYVDAEIGQANASYGYDYPVKTVAQAVWAARNLSARKENTYIILMPGRHEVAEEIAITEIMTDATTSLTFVSYDKNDKAVISGGTDISGKFEPDTNGIWKAPVTVGTESRDLYVNGVKAQKARTRDLDATEFVNTTTRNASNENLIGSLGTLKTSSPEFTALKDVKHPEDLEFVFFMLWSMNRCQATSIKENADGSISFNMDSPGWYSLNTQNHIYARTPVYIENAYEFIDEPGEWYLDSHEGYVYYMPRAADDMETAEVMLPTLDNDEQYLLSVIGSAEESVQNVTFDNIIFSHTTWNRPSTAVGHVATQNNLLSDYYEAEGTGRYSTERLRTIESAIEIQNTNNITFRGCEFSRLGGNGIRIFWNVQNCDITGCEFYDISSSAINIGDANTEDNTKLGQLQNNANINNVTMSDNYIHHVARDYWSASAIGVTWAQDVLITHNEIAHIPYSGMHIGMGWEGDASAEVPDLTIDITNNYIHDAFCYGYVYDGAPIYTNGLTSGTASNPNEISGNYIETVGPGAASIYNDEGSAYYYVHDNVMDVRNSWEENCRTTGSLKGTASTQNINLTSTARPHGLVWKNNYAATRKSQVQPKAYQDSSNDIDLCIMIGASGDWCDEAKEIMANAGIRDAYRDNFRYGLREIDVIDEVEIKAGESLSAMPTLLTAKNEGYKSNSLYCTATSSDETVAIINDGRIEAVGQGEATITYEVVENGVLYTAKTLVSVSAVAEYISDLTKYYMSFENGGSLRLMVAGKGYYNVQEGADTTNGSETFRIVANPKGYGKVVKLDLAGTMAGDASTVALSTNTAANSTGHAKATLPAGATVTYTFKYYWPEEMESSNGPQFCIYNATGGIFATGTDFKTEANKWHTAVLTYTNDKNTSIDIGNAQIRFCGANAPLRTWKLKNITDGTTYGARTVYIDNVTATIE